RGRRLHGVPCNRARTPPSRGVTAAWLRCKVRFPSEPMSRLVVVSNRVALPQQSRAGGLAVALDDALKATGGLWFGWSGKGTRDGTRGLHTVEAGSVQYVTMDLTEPEVAGYYDGFSNRTLWPALHYRLDLVEYSRDTHVVYRQVNARFAERLAGLLQPGDRVWIHDYHLLPLAAELRARGVRDRKSTRLNSSHVKISYAVFCLKKKKKRGL